VESLTTVAVETATLDLDQSDRSIVRLPFIEGARGYAALMIVIGHCAHASYKLLGVNSFLSASWGDRLVWCGWPATQMVDLFLMISGFSLFYSEDVRRRAHPPTTLALFAKRRAWRILPTYYVALAFGLLVLAIVPNHLIDGLPALGPEPVTLTGVLAHLVFIQNAHRPWLYQGNAPLWSMAFEVQLYFLFPLLYWACKRYPALLVTAAAILLDAVLVHLRGGLFVFGLLRWFALGILAAAIYRSERVQRIDTRLLIFVGSLLLAGAYAQPGFTGLKDDAVWGAAFLTLLIAMTRAPVTRRNPLNWRPMRWVGLRSYSLYAFHFPILWVVYAVLRSSGVPLGTDREALLFLIGVPLSLAVAHLAFRLIERPSLERVRAAR
jgi:peptidoglycan/LPS O-acetylase OafA/YrhL